MYMSIIINQPNLNQMHLENYEKKCESYYASY